MNKETCMMCHRPAKWMRSTQFAGDHPYCAVHAREEDDFMKNDSYHFWYKIKEEENESKS